MWPLLVSITDSPPSQPAFLCSFSLQKCWHSQINIWVMWPAHSHAKILGYGTPILSTDSRIRRNVVVDFFFLLLTWPSQTQCKANQKANWSRVFYGSVQVQQYFMWPSLFRERVSGNVVFTSIWMCRLSSFDWALPVLNARGFHSLPVPFTARALKSKLT